MPHLVLLGDSIFDNAAYVPGGPDVVVQVRRHLPANWRATLLAVDGAVTSGVRAQLARLPADATHLVLSVGGNDALGHTDLLDRRVTSSAQVLDALAEAAGSFEQRYRAAIADVVARDLPLTVCTIYNGAFPDHALQRRATVALTVFNDAILRVAFERGLPVIDLRLICSEPTDYANPIEPSVRGGEKIARTIVQTIIGRSPVSRRRSEIAIA